MMKLRNGLVNQTKTQLLGLSYRQYMSKKIDITEDKDIVQKLMDDARNEYKMWKNVNDVTSRLYSFYLDKLKIRDNFDFECKLWLNYSSTVRNKFSETSLFGLLSLDRPPESGNRFDFIDLSELIFINKNFKSYSFIFNNFCKTEFTMCDLSRVRFIGCNLEGVVFNECQFRGEEVCFYKVTGTFIFRNCSIEYTDKADMTSEPSEFAKILELRGLANTKCEINGNNITVFC